MGLGKLTKRAVIVALVSLAAMSIAIDAPASSRKKAPVPTPTPKWKVERQSSAWKGVDGSRSGYWFRFENTYFEWDDVIEVVAVYRRVMKYWLLDLKRKRVKSTADYRDDLVRSIVQKAGYDKLRRFVDDHIGYSKKGRDHSDGILLLDRNTGAVVGVMPVKSAKSASSFLDKNKGKEVQVQLEELRDANKRTTVAARKQDIRIDGYIYHASPIVLDLEGLGSPDLLAGEDWALSPDRELASAAALRGFDLDGTGEATWEWVGPTAGLLVWDPGGRGAIASGKQLFGNYTWGKSWKDGYEALATLDRDSNGKLSGTELLSLGVWVDADSDAVSRPAEVHRLDSLGIEALALDATRQEGNAWHPKGFSRRVAGGEAKTLPTWDWIALGRPRIAEGTYIWVGEEEGREFGGYLHLADDAGTIHGLSFPTVGHDPHPDGHIVAVPLAGEVEGQGATWRSPAPDGEIVTTVTWTEGGKRLFGHTRIDTSARKSGYSWQAELISGKGLAAAIRSAAGGR